MLGFCGELSRSAGEVNAKVQVLDFRLDSGKGTGGRNTMDNNLVPDFILLKTGCCSYSGSDSFLNGTPVSFDDRECRSIVFSDRFDVVVGSEVHSSNKRLLDF